MIRYLILFGLLFPIYQPLVHGQQAYYIRGKVIDSKTSGPVSFAAVHLKNSGVAVYTNAEGDFRILKSPGFQSDSLIVTCIGYYRLTMAFGKLEKSEINNLKLIPYIYSLNEVKINASKKRRLFSRDFIVARALQNIKKNSPDLPYTYVSYYRDYQKDSSNYLNLNEGIIQTLDKGFAYSSDSNRYRLLDFKKNMDFLRTDMTPYYDIPESEHSDEWFKKIPHAMVGDQNGNELFILLVHDAIRNFDKRSFSFVETLTKDFIRNHRFSDPVGIHEGNLLLYRIDFTAKPLFTNDLYQGAIYIQPDDYSIHKFEYSGSYLDPEKKKKEIFNIEIEYGREPAVNSRMCLRYISFNNTFTLPDSSDNNYFKVVKTEWWTSKTIYGPQLPPVTIITEFNRKIDPVSGNRKENYDLLVGKRKAKITHIKIDGHNLFITVKNEHFKKYELDSTFLNYRNLKDINGNVLNQRKGLEFRQFRELFVQEYNKPVEFQNNCFIQALPLEQNSISHSDNSIRYWMNTPLKAEEKQQDLKYE